jgi:hypothetical protein
LGPAFGELIAFSTASQIMAREKGFSRKSDIESFSALNATAAGVIPRNKNDWSFTPFRANAFRDVESATVRLFEIDHIDIKIFLLDRAGGASIHKL